MKAFAFFAFLCCCFASVNLFAQTPKTIEDDLLRSFNKIEYWGEHQYDTTQLNGQDSLSLANTKFQLKLKHYTDKYPFIFNKNFGSIKGLVINTSNDKLLKVYCWDDGTGGTMRYYKSVIQFKVKNRIISIDSDEGLFTNIYPIAVNGKTYYLLESYQQAMSNYLGGEIDVWTIENGYLNKTTKLFKTATGIKSSIGYAYWFDYKYEHKRDFIFNQNLNVLYIPLTTENEKLTGRYITYKFTGQYFERVKN